MVAREITSNHSEHLTVVNGPGQRDSATWIVSTGQQSFAPESA
jgi:hypothetical protein